MMTMTHAVSFMFNVGGATSDRDFEFLRHGQEFMRARGRGTIFTPKDAAK